MHRRHILKAGLAGLVTSQLNSQPAWAQRPGRWLRLESANFILYSSNREETARAEVIALERFHALLKRLRPRPERPMMKLEVYMAGSPNDFTQAAPELPSDVGGFYDAGVEGVRAVTSSRSAERQRDMNRMVRALDTRVVLFHEYAHHYMRANTRVSHTPWYNEGFAEFVSTADFTDTAVNLGKFTANRAAWLTMGGWLDIDSFLSKDSNRMSNDEKAMFYAQSWLATHYLFKNPERVAGYDRYVAALQTGADPLDAFEPAFGVSRKDFDSELRAYKRQSITIWVVPQTSSEATAQPVVTRLNSAADDLLIPASHLRSLPSPKNAPQTVARIRTQGAKFPDDPFARRCLALAEIWYGDLDTARRILDELLAIDGASAETLHLSGVCDLRRSIASEDIALAGKARGAFAAAHRIDDTRAHSLFRYVECVLMEEGELSEHLVDVLATAYNLAPQIDVIAMTTAQALMSHDRFGEAIAVLRPLVGELHAGERTAIARDLMAAAENKTAPPFVFYGSAARSLDAP